MAIDTNVQTFTNAELLALTKKAIADILVAGQHKSDSGKMLTRADLKVLMDTKETLEAIVQDEGTGDNGGGLALVQFGERV
jgi:hypothetical protein